MPVHNREMNRILREGEIDMTMVRKHRDVDAAGNTG
jgi:hypothetical protein